MSHPFRPAAALLTVAIATVPAGQAVAQETAVAVDVSAGGSYSTNPFLISGDSDGKGAFATELSVTPQVMYRDERSDAALIARYRRSDYIDRYNSAEGYGFTAQAQRALNPLLSANATVSFDSSIVGQSGLGVVGVVDPSLTPVPGIGLPVPGIGVPGVGVPGVSVPDLSLIGLNQRQNTLAASLGATLRVGPHDTLNGSVNANRVSYGSNSNIALLSSRGTGATIGYSRALSERTSVGIQGSGSWTEYDRNGFHGSSYSPQGTLSHRLGAQLNLDLAAGVVFISSTTTRGRSNVTGFSGSLSGCHTGNRSAQCLRAYSDAQATALGDISRRYGGSFDYSYRLRENDVLRASIGYSRLVATSDNTLQIPQVSYLNADAAYERSFTRRFFGGASVGYRQATGGGLGNPSDLIFRLFVRTRLGDRR